MKKLIFIIIISAIPLGIFAQYGIKNNKQTTSNNAFTFGFAGTYTDPLKKFNLSTPNNLITVGTTSGCIYSGIDFGAPGGYLFGLQKNSNTVCDLFRVDTITAASIILSTHNYTGTLACMTFDPKTWTHYILVTGTASKLYTFNPVPGDLLLVAQLSAMYTVSVIAINNSGSMYGIDEISDNLLRINKLTGTVTNIGTLGFNASGISGCDFDPLTGRLYLITPGAINPELRWIDTATGISTSEGMLLGNVKNLAIAGNSFQTPSLPSPPTLIYPTGTIYTATPLMDWSDAAGATTYHIQVTSGPTNVIDQNTAQSQYQVPPGILTNNTVYYWRVNGKNGAGISEWSVIAAFTCMISDVTKISSEIPKEFSLSQNYPNPFNPESKIQFSIPKTENRKQLNNGLSFPTASIGNPLVTLKIYDALGREVETLVNEALQPGTYEVTFDGSGFNSGVYFYRLQAGEFTETKRMFLIK
jgi:hypothetical protein